MGEGMKKTQWFPADVKPVHIGVYECERWEQGFRMVKRKLHWSGAGWSYSVKVPEYGLSAGHHAAMFPNQGDRWRGLTKEQK
jgi:hypothetical protein